MKKFIIVLSVFLISLMGYSENIASKKKLTLGFMPYLSSQQIIKKYQPLADYLSAELGQEVVIEIAKDYSTHLRATGEDKLDISFLGGSPYVVVVDKYGPKPLMARFEFNHRPHFRSVFYTSEDSDIKTLKDLKGKSVVFGSRRSTLSTQVPLYMLMQAGLTTDDFDYEFLNNQENVYISVLLGGHDGGASAEEVFAENSNKGLRVIEYSPYLSTHVFVTRSDMDKDLQDKVQKALFKLSSLPEGDAVLKSISKTLTGFVEVQDSDYNLLRGILKEVLPILE